jgi:hypothetical protein
MSPTDFDDVLEPADRDIAYNWGLGVIVAAALAYDGLKCIWTQSGTFVGGGRWSSIPLQAEGAMAVSVGIFYFAAGCFLHCKYFWSSRERFLGSAQIGIIASLVGVAIGMISFIYYWLR